MEYLPLIIVIALIAIILGILVSCLKIVPQAQAYVIERLVRRLACEDAFFG